MVWVKTKSVYGVLEQFSQGIGMQRGFKIHYVDDGYLFIYLFMYVCRKERQFRHTC